MIKTTQLSLSNSIYLSKKNICEVMLMATLLPLTKIKIMLSMPPLSWILTSIDSTIDSLFIFDFYFQFMNLWVEYINIIYASLTFEDLSSVQKVHETTKQDQFLMKLRFNFDDIRSNLMHRDLIPSLDALNDLLHEEQCLLI
ncbi:hypothetical protein CR513_57005, partial [Mucuna pruriens]